MREHRPDSTEVAALGFDSFNLETPCAELVLGLVKAGKARSPRQTLGVVCRKARLPSRAYLSDVMQGRRKLGLKHVDGLADAFALDGLEREYLRALTRRDQARSAARRAAVGEQAAALGRALLARRPAPGPSHPGDVEAFELYCAIVNRPETPVADICRRVLPRLGADDARRALARLLAAQLVAPAGDGYRAREDLVVFHAGEGRSQPLVDFLRSMLSAAHTAAPAWFDRRDQAFFQSMIFAVSERKVKDFVNRLRAAVSELQDEMNRSQGEVLVHFNVALCPSSNSALAAQH